MAGIFLHIPFCSQKCIYCDFFSIVSNKYQDSYTEALCRELKLRINEIPKNEVYTIYIGGGTPSILSHSNLKKIVKAIKDELDFSKIAEFTIEVNPDDVNPECAQLLTSLGVNRVSMGVQTLNDNELKIIKRRHTAQQAINEIGRASCRERVYVL